MARPPPSTRPGPQDHRPGGGRPRGTAPARRGLPQAGRLAAARGAAWRPKTPHLPRPRFPGAVVVGRLADLTAPHQAPMGAVWVPSLRRGAGQCRLTGQHHAPVCTAWARASDGWSAGGLSPSCWSRAPDQESGALARMRPDARVSPDSLSGDDGPKLRPHCDHATRDGWGTDARLGSAMWRLTRSNGDRKGRGGWLGTGDG
jgi:hypothetical protein